MTGRRPVRNLIPLGEGVYTITETCRISRTVAYGALTGVVGVIYAAVVVSVGAFVASPVAAAAGALVVAVTFWPCAGAFRTSWTSGSAELGMSPVG
jgi:hypothetical protein